MMRTRLQLVRYLHEPETEQKMAMRLSVGFPLYYAAYTSATRSPADLSHAKWC